MNSPKDRESDIGPLFPEIGYVIIQWSFIEQSLDMCIASLYQHQNSRKIANTVPKKLKEKCRYMHEAIGAFSFPADLAKAADAALGKIANLKDYRHDFAHSALASPFAENGVYKFHALISDDSNHYHKVWQFDINKAPRMRQKLQELVTQMHRLAGLVLDFSDTLQ
jgi:hypothetical protein